MFWLIFTILLGVEAVTLQPAQGDKYCIFKSNILSLRGGNRTPIKRFYRPPHRHFATQSFGGIYSHGDMIMDLVLLFIRRKKYGYFEKSENIFL